MYLLPLSYFTVGIQEPQPRQRTSCPLHHRAHLVQSGLTSKGPQPSASTAPSLLATAAHGTNWPWAGQPHSLDFVQIFVVLPGAKRYISTYS